MKKQLTMILAALMLFSAAPASLAEGGETPETPGAEISAITAEDASAATVSPVPETATPAPETPTPAQESPTAVPETASPVPETAAPSATPTPEATATPLPTEATMPPEAQPTDDGTKRVTMGADLTSAQRKAVYADFGIEEGSVTELTVTNKEEREYLEDLVPDRKIGSVALSCIYIERLNEGDGLTIEVHNINYCTENMYKNALLTAGITDAKVIVSAPFPVSGTGALTGVYKAYESMTGESLSALAKSVGAEELVVTGELAEYIGSEEAAQLISQLKAMLDETQKMSDGQVREEVSKLAKLYNISLSDSQVEQVRSLVRKLEGLDEEELQSRLTSLANTAKTASEAAGVATKVYESVKGFFASVGSFFARIFAKNA